MLGACEGACDIDGGFVGMLCASLVLALLLVFVLFKWLVLRSRVARATGESARLMG